MKKVIRKAKQKDKIEHLVIVRHLGVAKLENRVIENLSAALQSKFILGWEGLCIPSKVVYHWVQVVVGNQLHW